MVTGTLENNDASVDNIKDTKDNNVICNDEANCISVIYGSPEATNLNDPSEEEGIKISGTIHNGDDDQLEDL